MSCDRPLEAFIEKLVEDLKDSHVYVSDILCRLQASAKVYDDKKPSNTLSNITNDLVNCLEPKISSDTKLLGESIGRLIIIIVIVTAIFIFLTIISVVILKNNDIGIILLFVFFILILYIIICILIIYNSSLSLSNDVESIKTSIIDCVSNAQIEINVLENDQQNAINEALCVYQLPCIIPVKI